MAFITAFLCSCYHVGNSFWMRRMAECTLAGVFWVNFTNITCRRVNPFAWWSVVALSTLPGILLIFVILLVAFTCLFGVFIVGFRLLHRGSTRSTRSNESNISVEPRAIEENLVTLFTIHVKPENAIIDRDDPDQNAAVLPILEQSESDAPTATAQIPTEMVYIEAGECCAICLDSFQDGDVGAKVAVCGHLYHHVCIASWLARRRVCPLCKRSLTV